MKSIILMDANIIDGSKWDISGNWEVDLQGHEREFVNLEQNENGVVRGEFWYRSINAW